MKDKDFEELWNSGATARKYRQCHISDQELDKIIGKAIDRDKQTRQKHFTIRKRPYLYPAMAVACVAALMVALWQVRTNSVFIPNTPEALQPSASVLVAQAEAPAATPQTTAQQAARPMPQHTVAKAEASVADGQNTATDVPTHNRTDHDAALPNTDTVATIYDEPANTPNYRYLACADIQSYKTDTREYFCSSDCTGEYMVQAVCEMINCI